MIRTIEELYDLLPKLEESNAVEFHGKVSAYMVKRLEDGTFECLRISSWADREDNFLPVKPVTVLKRYNEVYGEVTR